MTETLNADCQEYGVPNCLELQIVGQALFSCFQQRVLQILNYPV